MKTIIALVALSWSLTAQVEPGGGKVFRSPQPDGAVERKGRQPLYYFTRMAPNGSEERVTAPYTFAVRSKANLVVLPTEEGHLAVFIGSSADLSKQQLYFPFHKMRAEDTDLVHKGETIKIPISFDDKPGETMMTVAVIGKDDHSEKIITALHYEPSAASVLLKSYLVGGKGIVPPDDDMPTVQPPVIWGKLTLRNR